MEHRDDRKRHPVDAFSRPCRSSPMMSSFYRGLHFACPGLYRMALEAVAQGKDLAATSFNLCPVCGHVELDAPPASCPICGAKAEKFVQA
jgi:hypothetical protein